jgi:RNA polymerase sigma-70 factor (ECF subfamily)
VPAASKLGIVADDDQLMTAARQGDESALASLVRHYQSWMAWLATQLTGRPDAAEPVTRAAWLVLRAAPVEPASAGPRPLAVDLLMACARAALAHDPENEPRSAFDPLEPSIDAARFTPDGRWAEPPRHWADDLTLDGPVQNAIERLPSDQRRVLVLRDAEGLDPTQVRDLLGIDVEQQRVLLHRARSRVRRIVEEQVAE